MSEHKKPIMVPCDCGLLAFKNEHDAKAAIRYKSEVQRYRNYDYVECPCSYYFHIFNKDITSKESYLRGLSSGRLGEAYREKFASQQRIFYGERGGFIRYRDKSELAEIKEAVCKEYERNIKM